MPATCRSQTRRLLCRLLAAYRSACTTSWRRWTAEMAPFASERHVRGRRSMREGQSWKSRAVRARDRLAATTSSLVEQTRNSSQNVPILNPVRPSASPAAHASMYRRPAESSAGGWTKSKSATVWSRLIGWEGGCFPRFSSCSTAGKMQASRPCVGSLSGQRKPRAQVRSWSAARITCWVLSCLGPRFERLQTFALDPSSTFATTRSRTSVPSY
mmetsp:Transcript_10965/g.33641  ORF Transcript_10965/g.33641 Transcript_10965/m.33641 type:complete len:214 (-) Transcript_10965:1252-1893(-)